MNNKFFINFKLPNFLNIKKHNYLCFKYFYLTIKILTKFS